MSIGFRHERGCSAASVPVIVREVMKARVSDPAPEKVTARVARAREGDNQVDCGFNPLGSKVPTILKAHFKTAKSGGAEALIVISNPLSNTHRARIVDLAAKHRQP